MSMSDQKDFNKLAIIYAHHRDATIYRHGRLGSPTDNQQLLDFYKSVSCDRTLLSSYKDLCKFADHLKNEYEYDINSPPCTKDKFKDIVLDIHRKEQEIMAISKSNDVNDNDDAAEITPQRSV